MPVALDADFVICESGQPDWPESGPRWRWIATCLRCKIQCDSCQWLWSPVDEQPDV